ncbi:MAG: hypothetical protein ABL898_16915 [Hyphomicrobiaceae bacterium]|nr:hypothetical protein [Hyphomicrobiaceae bacterium]
MSKTNTAHQREEIEMLLPWFVTGKLDAIDRARVETWLAQDPVMKRQLGLIEEDRELSIRINEAVNAPRTLTVERSMAAVFSGAMTGLRRPGAGYLERVRTFFAQPTAQGLRWAAAAAAIVIVAQGIWLSSLLTGESYVTASSSPSAASATAIVKFQDSARATDIVAALQALNMSVVDGPKPGGTFVVRLSVGQLSKAERDVRITALRQVGNIVAQVLP